MNTNGFTIVTLYDGRMDAVFAPDVADELRAGLGDPEGVVARPEFKIVRERDRRITGTVEIAGTKVFVKRFEPQSLWQMWRGWLFGSPAANHLYRHYQLLGDGVASPAPIAVMEERAGGRLRCAFLFTRMIDGSATLKDFFLGRHGLTVPPRVRRRVVRAVGETAGRLYRGNYYHNDLRIKNFMPGMDGLLYLLDLDRCVRFEGIFRPVTWIPRLLDLRKLLLSFKKSLSRREVLLLLSGYRATAKISGRAIARRLRLIRYRFDENMASD